MQNARFIIQRFELYPAENPDHYLVGFKVICRTNDKQGYAEARVSIDEAKGKNHHEICEAAYRKAKQEINEQFRQLEAIPAVLGTEFIPTDDE